MHKIGVSGVEDESVSAEAVDAAAVRELAGALARKLRIPCLWQEDMVQEVAIYFWSHRCEFAGQTRSWCVQRCWHCLENLFRKGHSVDSIKHHASAVSFSDPAEPPDSAEQESLSEALGCDDSLPSALSARDAKAALLSRLSRREQFVLCDLDDGLSTDEIARKRKLSPKSIRKDRAHIARLAMAIGFSPERAARPAPASAAAA